MPTHKKPSSRHGSRRARLVVFLVLIGVVGAAIGSWKLLFTGKDQQKKEENGKKEEDEETEDTEDTEETEEPSESCTTNEECETKTNGKRPVCSSNNECVECLDDVTCEEKHGNMKPYCSQEKLECVECTTAGDCEEIYGDSERICADNKCAFPCTSDNGCASGEHCLNKTRCVECTGDSHCTSEDKPYCDVKDTYTCVQCTTYLNQCSKKYGNKRPDCKMDEHKCVECTKDTTCKHATDNHKPFCDKESNTCVPCNKDCEDGKVCVYHNLRDEDVSTCEECGTARDCEYWPFQKCNKEYKCELRWIALGPAIAISFLIVVVGGSYVLGKLVRAAKKKPNNAEQSATGRGKTGNTKKPKSKSESKSSKAKLRMFKESGGVVSVSAANTRLHGVHEHNESLLKQIKGAGNKVAYKLKIKEAKEHARNAYKDWLKVAERRVKNVSEEEREKWAVDKMWESFPTLAKLITTKDGDIEEKQDYDE